MTHSFAAIQQLLDDHGVSPSRALGQNFVADANTVRRITRLAGVSRGDNVLEIGAGLGSLTLALVETGANVTAVELDKYLVPILRTVVADHNVRVIEGDAMKLDWSSVLGEDVWTLVANLPYNVATPLVMDLLDDVPAITDMLVMVQREVGERMAAPPGSKIYGAVSAKIAYAATAEVVGIVPPTVFIPKPRVDSALVRIVRREAPLVPNVERQALFAVIETGFAQRRKMLRSALRPLFGDKAELILVAAGVDPTARAETLDVMAFGRIAAAAQASGQTFEL